MSDTFCGYDGKRDEVIVAYVYGELDGDERALFARHLSRCAACQHEIDALGDVRTQLGAWTPPETGTVVNPQVAAERPLRAVGPVTAPASAAGTAPVSTGHATWRAVPAWAQFAAAMLFMGMAAGLANLHVTYNADGLSMRTGWSDAATTRTSSVSQAVPAATQSDLAALAQQLRTELQPVATTASTAAAPAGLSDEEIVRRVRALIRDSEQRQQRELALRVAEVAQDVQLQRQADLVRIDRTLGALQTTTGTAVRRQEQLLNNLAVRVSQRQ